MALSSDSDTLKCQMYFYFIDTNKTIVECFRSAKK